MTEFRPLVATPCYGGALFINYVTSVLRLRSALWQLGIEHDFYLYAGESLITRARNECVAHFMAGECTHLFWIDADIGFEPKDAVKLLTSGKPVVAGIYPKKSEKLQFPLDMETIGIPDDAGLAEVNEAPTGFMCIERSVFEQLFAAGVHRNEVFDTMRLGDDYLSEDYAFCHRWRKVGGKVYADLGVSLSHQGTKLFTGNIMEAMNG
jgi:hypothetical protein